MPGYTKLFQSIIHSTIWREPDHVRLIWITMLALADKKGTVEASIPGLADLARVTLEECEEAIEKLKSPDKYSRNQDFDGRRIDETPGGWLLLNHDYYREQGRIEDERERKRKWWRENRGKKTPETIEEKEKLAQTSGTSADSRGLAEPSFPDPSPSPDPSPKGVGARAQDAIDRDTDMAALRASQGQQDPRPTGQLLRIVDACCERFTEWPRVQAEANMKDLAKGHPDLVLDDWRAIFSKAWERRGDEPPRFYRRIISQHIDYFKQDRDKAPAPARAERFCPRGLFLEDGKTVEQCVAYALKWKTFEPGEELLVYSDMAEGGPPEQRDKWAARRDELRERMRAEREAKPAATAADGGG